MRRMAWIGFLGTLAFALGADALSTTLVAQTPQGIKRADFTLGTSMASDFFDVSGTLDVDVEIAANPLESTLRIGSAELLLTDMRFDFAAGPSFITAVDMVATISTALLTASAFDGTDTYSFDLTGGDFFIIDAVRHSTTSDRGSPERRTSR